MNEQLVPYREMHFGLSAAVTAVLTITLVAVALSAPAVADSASSTVDTNDTTPLQTSAQPFWEGQQLRIDAPDSDAGVNYELYRVVEDDGEFHVDEFVSNITLDDSGDAVLNTGRSVVDPGGYVVLDQNGNAVVFASDGTVDNRLATRNVVGAEFHIREQVLSATLEDGYLAPGENTTLSLDSNRAAYNVTVTSPSLSNNQLTALVGATEISVTNSATTYNGTTESIPQGTYEITFETVETNVSSVATVTITEDADEDDADEEQPVLDRPTVPVESDAEPYYTGQQLLVDAPASESNVNYALHSVRQNNATYDVREFRTEVTLNESGDAIIDTASFEIGQGTYVLLDDDGNAVVFGEDGTVEQRLSTADVTGAQFAVRGHELDIEFDDSSLLVGQTTTLELDSSRDRYNLSITSPGLSEDHLETLLGTTTQSVTSMEESINVTAESIPAGVYDVSFEVVDTGQTLTRTISIDASQSEQPLANAANLDSDPLLEDVNGDGNGDIFDALAYYNNRDSEQVQNNPSQFDYDGDDESGTIFDALALYNDVAK